MCGCVASLSNSASSRASARALLLAMGDTSISLMTTGSGAVLLQVLAKWMTLRKGPSRVLSIM